MMQMLRAHVYHIWVSRPAHDLTCLEHSKSVGHLALMLSIPVQPSVQDICSSLAGRLFGVML